MIDRCPKCKAWIYSYDGKHECPPLWLVQCPEYDDETWEEVYAVAAEYAAEKYAEDYDADSHDMMCGETIVVVVYLEEEYIAWRMDNTGITDPVKTFTCSGEAVPTYTAEEIVESDKAGDTDD